MTWHSKSLQSGAKWCNVRPAGPGLVAKPNRAKVGSGLAHNQLSAQAALYASDGAATDKLIGICFCARHVLSASRVNRFPNRYGGPIL